ncbi:MAG: PIN domain-containing protein [Candidatus Lokiarchaeota archaeon]|nr:PIN domain-containing protein [Candidatus Lokiarchaeota archaeon]
MAKRVCLDAGPISLYYQRNPPKEIKALIKNIKSKKFSAFVCHVIFVEVFKHLCIAGGKKYAANCIRSFQLNVPYKSFSLTAETIIDAGLLKCQYRKILSYNDCLSITLALKNNAEFHTTEKELPDIARLRTVKYKF